MAALLEVICSFGFGGLLLAMVVRLNIYISSCHQQSTYNLHVQEYCVELGTILEHDFYKIGYRDSSGSPIRLADTSSIKFYADIDDNGAIDSIRYYIGSTVSSNPHHKAVYRQVNTSAPVSMDLGVSRFYLTYYDSAGIKTVTLSKIRAVKVSMNLESEFQSVTSGGADIVYDTVHWEQFIVPKAFHF